MMLRILKPLLFSIVFATVCAAQTNSIDKILERGTLKIGVANFAPWTFTNINDHLEGFDIDVGAMIAHDMGVTPEFIMLELDEFPDALESGKIDIVAAGLAITPARALIYDFSNPYFTTSVAVVASREIAEGVESVDGLNQDPVKIAIVEDTYSAEIAAVYIEPENLSIFPDSEAANKALIGGEVQALFTNLPDARVLTTRHPESLIAPFTDAIISSVAGIAVKRGNQSLLNYLNAWIAARDADNWLDKTCNYWFTSGDWINHIQSKN